MARALIVGCGCRGVELGGQLRSLGWHVRGTSRRPPGLEAIESAGLEPASADPGRPGTVLDLCDDVSVVVWLLGSADGEEELVSAVHGPRLERLMEKLVESPVRGFAYEAVGTAEESFLREGRGIVQRAGETWRIPVAVLTTPRDESGWAERTGDQVEKLLTG